MGKTFVSLSREDDMIERDDLIIACRELQNHISTDSDDFRRALEDINPNPKAKFNLTDFLVLQAKLRKPPPEIEVALLSLTDDEFQRHAEIFHAYREANPNGTAITTPPELRAVLGQLHHPNIQHPPPMDQVRRLMQNAELDGSRQMHLREFLYILVMIGVGTSDRPRCILLPGASYQDAFRMGFPLKELWELGYDDLVEIRKAGWSAQEVHKAGLAEAWQLRQVGYGAVDLRKIVCKASQLKLAGFSLEELRNAGFSSDFCANAVQFLASIVRRGRMRTLVLPS